MPPRKSSAGLWGVRLHQSLSFSPLFMQILAGGGERAFFPGCSMAGHSSGLVRSVYEWLRTADSRMGLASACCGHPTLCLGGGEPFREYQERLARSLSRAGIGELVVCCPNCAGTLQGLAGVEVLSIWSLLDRMKVVFPVKRGGAYVLHDPCPTRDDPETQRAFRRVMERNGVSWEEYPSHGVRAICCGKRDMLMVLDPGRGRKILERRIAESPNRNVLTYCFSCVQSFASAGCQSVHGLELLFGASDAERGGVWANRCRTALWAMRARAGGRGL